MTQYKLVKRNLRNFNLTSCNFHVQPRFAFQIKQAVQIYYRFHIGWPSAQDLKKISKILGPVEFARYAQESRSEE